MSRALLTLLITIVAPHFADLAWADPATDRSFSVRCVGMSLTGEVQRDTLDSGQGANFWQPNIAVGSEEKAPTERRTGERLETTSVRNAEGKPRNNRLLDAPFASRPSRLATLPAFSSGPPAFPLAREYGQSGATAPV